MKFKLSHILIVNELVKRTGWYRSIVPDMDNYPTNEWYRTNLQRNFDVVNIGSSSARHAFDYSGLGLKAFNWADQPQALSYGYKILRKYHGILKKGGTVIISIGPFSAFDISGKLPEDAFDRYYYLLDPYDIEGYDRMRRRRRWPLYFNFKASLHALKREYVLHKKLSDGRVCTDFAADASRWIRLWLKEFSMTSLDAPLSEENLAGRRARVSLLKEIISFCNERELRPVVVIPPMHKALYDMFPEGFVEENIRSFVHEAAGDACEFHDHMGDVRFQKDEYFADSFLMNARGAGEFTRFIMNRLGMTQ